MADITTDWFPRDVPPVHPGEYDVTIREDLVTEVEVRAQWSKRFGRFGFWKVQTWATSMHAEELNVIRWRGRELPPRVALLDTDIQPVRPRRLLIQS